MQRIAIHRPATPMRRAALYRPHLQIGGWRCLLGAFLVLASLSGDAAARPGKAEQDALLDRLESEELSEVRDAIAKLGSVGDDRARGVLEAFGERRLHVARDGSLLVERDDGLRRISDGAIVPESEKARSLTLNNVIRRSLGPALAQLRLRSDDVHVRRKAAEVLAEDADPQLAQGIRETLSSEPDAQVRDDLQLALARIDLMSDDPQRTSEAVAIIADRGDVTLKPLLESVVLRLEAEQELSDARAETLATARAAVQAMERQELFSRIVRDLFYGLSLGSVLLLASLGLAITFGVMGVINMAHGEMLMLGAYSTYVVQLLFQEHAPHATSWYLAGAVPVAFAVTMLVGMFLERTVIRFLYGRPLETLLATWGISLMLIQSVRLAFGAQNVNVANPDWLSGGATLMQGVVLPYNRIGTVAFVTAVVGLIWFLLNRTGLGLSVRAITQNRDMAKAMGISTRKVDTLTFGLGSGVAGLGGVALSQIGNVGPELGQSYIVDSFMVVVLGGVGKLTGTVVAAIGLGGVNKLLEPVSGAVLGKILVLVFVILFIQKRPRGLFAVKGRAAEA